MLDLKKQIILQISLSTSDPIKPGWVIIIVGQVFQYQVCWTGIFPFNINNGYYLSIIPYLSRRKSLSLSSTTCRHCNVWRGDLALYYFEPNQSPPLLNKENWFTHLWWRFFRRPSHNNNLERCFLILYHNLSRSS